MIDEVHTLIGAGAAEGAIDAANILKPALARGELQCIGATTVRGWSGRAAPHAHGLAQLAPQGRAAAARAPRLPAGGAGGFRRLQESSQQAASR